MRHTSEREVLDLLRGMLAKGLAGEDRYAEVVWNGNGESALVMYHDNMSAHIVHLAQADRLADFATVSSYVEAVRKYSSTRVVDVNGKVH